MARYTIHCVPKLVLVLLLWPLRPAAVFPACLGAIMQLLIRSASAVVHCTYPSACRKRIEKPANRSTVNHPIFRSASAAQCVGAVTNCGCELLGAVANCCQFETCMEQVDECSSQYNVSGITKVETILVPTLLSRVHVAAATGQCTHPAESSSRTTAAPLNPLSSSSALVSPCQHQPQ